MKIKTFCELSKEQVNFIAEQNYSYWKKISPTLDYQTSTSNILAMKNNKSELPVGLALLNNKNEIVGFCTLRTDRLKKHLNFNPWICNVFVFENFRGKGFGKQIVESACDFYKNLGYKEVFVWTDQSPDFYTKLGFKYVQKVEKNEGGEALLFKKEI